MKIVTLGLGDKRGIEQQDESFVIYDGRVGIRFDFKDADKIIEFVKNIKSGLPTKGETINHID